MSANINTYIGRKPAWHELGTVTGKHMTWQDVAAEPGMSFDVVKRQLEWNGSPVEAWGTFRTDNDAFLGSVGEGYTVIDHKSGFEMIDQLLTENGAHYETAGVLGAGEVVWGLADLNVSIKVGGVDETKGYLLFSTSYNGTRAHQWKKVGTRVVCQNTLAVALRESSAQFKVWHNRQAVARLEDARKAIASLKNEFATLEDMLNTLNERRMVRETAESIIARLFPVPDGPTAKAYQSRRENATVGILSAFESNDNNAFPEQRGTAYNFLNAVTEWTDHLRGGRGENAKSAMFGSGDQLKQKAFEMLLESANGLPITNQRRVYIEAPIEAPQDLLDDVLNATVS